MQKNDASSASLQPIRHYRTHNQHHSLYDCLKVMQKNKHEKKEKMILCIFKILVVQCSNVQTQCSFDAYTSKHLIHAGVNTHLLNMVVPPV